MVLLLEIRFLKPVAAGRRNQHAGRVRSPENAVRIFRDDAPQGSP